METGREWGVTEIQTTETDYANDVLVSTDWVQAHLDEFQSDEYLIIAVAVEISNRRITEGVDVTSGTLKSRTLKFIRYAISDDEAYHEIKVWNPLSVYFSKDSAATRPSPYMIRISLSGSSSMSASTGYVQTGVSRS